MKQKKNIPNPYASPVISDRVDADMKKRINDLFGADLKFKSTWDEALDAIPESTGIQIDSKIELPQDKEFASITISKGDDKKELKIPNGELYLQDGTLNWNYYYKRCIQGVLDMLEASAAQPHMIAPTSKKSKRVQKNGEEVESKACATRKSKQSKSAAKKKKVTSKTTSHNRSRTRDVQ